MNVAPSTKGADRPVAGIGKHPPLPFIVGAVAALLLFVAAVFAIPALQGPNEGGAEDASAVSDLGAASSGDIDGPSDSMEGENRDLTPAQQEILDGGVPLTPEQSSANQSLTDGFVTTDGKYIYLVAGPYLYRSLPDGSDCKVIWEGDDFFCAISLVFAKDRLFFVGRDKEPTTYKIHSMNPDGSDDTVIYELPAESPLIVSPKIDVFGDRLYVLMDIESGASSARLVSMALDGSDQQLLGDIDVAVSGHLMMTDAFLLYQKSDASNPVIIRYDIASGTEHEVYRATADKAGNKVGFAINTVYNKLANKIFFQIERNGATEADGAIIASIDPDGSNYTEIAYGGENTSLIGMSSRYLYAAIDTDGDYGDILGIDCSSGAIAFTNADAYSTYGSLPEIYDIGNGLFINGFEVDISDYEGNTLFSYRVPDNS